MLYIVILIILIALYFVLNYNDKTNEKIISKTQPSNIIKTVYADGDDNYALIVYNHDEHDEEQLIWALSNASGIDGLKRENIYLLNLSTDILCRRFNGGIFRRLHNTDFTILKGKEEHGTTSYMIIITEKINNIVFNVDVAP